MRQLWENLRGARRLGIFAALTALALVALLLLGNSGQRSATREGTALEARLASLLEQIDGVQDVHVMIAEQDGTISGAVVVCGGLEGVRAYLGIQSTVQALLGLEADRVRILGGDGMGGGIS